MEAVPIIFEYKGQVFTGEFSPTHGSGSSPGSSWHLMVGKFYYGKLHYSEHCKAFLFHGNDFEDQSAYFEAYMIGWFA